MKHMKKWLLLLLFLLILTGCKFGLEQKGVMVKDVVVTKLDSNNRSISFSVKNLNNSAADCYVNISLDEKELHKDIGVIEAKSEKKKQIISAFKNEKSQISIKPICRWIDEYTVKKCNIGDYINRRICESALKKPRLQQCLDSNITSYRLFCISLISKRPEICNYIKSSSRRNWCKAYITGNISFCENIRDGKKKDWCYTDLGINFKNLTICDKVSDVKSRTSCIAVATSKPELCLEGAEEFKIACVTNIAELTGNKNICELLGEQKEECSELK